MINRNSAMIPHRIAVPAKPAETPAKLGQMIRATHPFSRWFFRIFSLIASLYVLLLCIAAIMAPDMQLLWAIPGALAFVALASYFWFMMKQLTGIVVDAAGIQLWPNGLRLEYGEASEIDISPDGGSNNIVRLHTGALTKPHVLGTLTSRKGAMELSLVGFGDGARAEICRLIAESHAAFKSDHSNISS